MFDGRQGHNIFVYYTSSRLDLRSSQSSIPRVLGVLSSRLKWPARRFDHSLPTNMEIKTRGAKPRLSHTSLFLTLN